MRVAPDLVEGPVTEDDAFIADSLRSTNALALLLAIACLSGDVGLLDHASVGPVSFADPEGGLNEDDRARIREAALRALRAYRDAGSPAPAAPAEAMITRLVERVTGLSTSDEYLKMMREEMQLSDADPRALHWTDETPPAAAKSFHTLVIGAGLGGMLAAIRLREAGLPYMVIEKNGTVGGTWYENSYPGCRVDVINHFYSYSFEPNHDWSEQFSRRNELHAYFEHCADKYGIRENIRFRTEVVAARWDESSAKWQVTLRLPDGGTEFVEANAVVSAVGQLNRPSIPEIEGQERFQGAAFHSAQWRHNVDLKSKRVAVIGTGASAFQLVPEVAKIASKLTVFQRAPHWMYPNPVYHDAVPEGKKWALKKIPFYARWYRFILFWTTSDGLLPSITMDPAWPHKARAVSAANDAQREAFTAAIVAQLEGRPDLLEKVIPEYPPFGKRILQDNGQWIGALKRENVALVNAGIERIAETGLVDSNGHEHEVDVIIYATGFHAGRFLWPMRIEGRNGRLLNEVWGDEPRAYLGITVPDFPNLFCIYGPGTNLAHGGSLIFHSECQVRYIANCIKYLVEHHDAAMDVKPSTYRDYATRLHDTAQQMVWAHDGVTNWYKNARGIVINVSPWRLIDYWRWTQEPQPEDFRFITETRSAIVTA